MASNTLSKIIADINALQTLVGDQAKTIHQLHERLTDKDKQIDQLKKVSRALVMGLYDPLSEDKHILHLLHSGGLMKNYEKREYERRAIGTDPEVIKEADSFWRLFSTRRGVLLENTVEQLVKTVRQNYEELSDNKIDILKKLGDLYRQKLDTKVRRLNEKVDLIENKEDELRARLDLLGDANQVMPTYDKDYEEEFKSDGYDDVISLSDDTSEYDNEDSDSEDEGSDDSDSEDDINDKEHSVVKIEDYNTKNDHFVWYFTFICIVCNVLLGVCVYLL